jgi:hypothetical protein
VLPVELPVVPAPAPVLLPVVLPVVPAPVLLLPLPVVPVRPLALPEPDMLALVRMNCEPPAPCREVVSPAVDCPLALPLPDPDPDCRQPVTVTVCALLDPLWPL